MIRPERLDLSARMPTLRAADVAASLRHVTFDDRGEHELKGISEAQRLFAVREQD